MEDWVDFLRSIAEDIRNEVLPLFGKTEASREVWLKEVSDTRVRIDAVAARVLLRRLKDAGRSVMLVSEECGEVRFGTSPKQYLVADEVDGTTNATHGIPFYATSLALCDGPRLSDAQQGVVMNLANGDIYAAKRGGGAEKNGSKLHPSRRADLEEALLVLAASPSSGATVEELIPFFQSCKHIRHYGAAALELCLLAEGRIDAFVDLRDRLRVTDVAASLLVLREAGGAVVGHPRKTLGARLKHDKKVSFLAAGNERLLKNLGAKLR